MSKFIADASMDAALQWLEDNVAFLHLCSGDPTNFAQVGTNSLGNVGITSAAFTIADGDTSGRKSTMAQQSIGSASGSGLAATLCLVDASTLVWKTDLTSTQNITAGNPVTINAVDVNEIRDPT